MNNLYWLEKYFTTGTAEAEGHILADAFVPLANYLEIVNPPHASPRLLIGKKGSGKSAFMTVLKDRLSSANIPAVLIKPENIAVDQFFKDSSIGQLVKQATGALLDAIAGQLGSQLGGLLTKNDEITLSKHAQKTGRADKDFVQKTLQVLAPIGAAPTKIDFEKMSKDFGMGTVEEIKRAVVMNLGKSGKAFYLLLDDTDQVAIPSEPHHLNRIWAFLLAARSICQQSENIRCIVTLRTEVWIRLQRDYAGQRDQVDHFRGLVYWLNPAEADVGNIVERRLKLAANELGARDADPYLPFFQDREVTIPTTSETRSWRDFIAKRARERPRDAVQLISLLIKTARTAKADKINSIHVATSIVQYSEERVDDLRREVDQECQQIKEIVRSFAALQYDDGPFTLNSDALKKHLLTLPTRFGITLFGAVLRPNNEDDLFALWRFLFEVGFFAPRKADARQPKGYVHINVRDASDLVSKARWNDVQKYHWEIHPAYRDFLIAAHNHDTFGLRLPSRRKPQSKSR